MVRGITTTLKHTLGYFVTAAVTAAVQLFPLFWRAVGILELSCSLTVVISTLDGALANRRFFMMYAGIQGNTAKGVTFCAKNLFLYVFSDVPHL